MLTKKKLKELLHYDPDTGAFVWKVSRSGTAMAGTVAGTTDDKGYRRIVISGKQYLAHRLAWLYVYGEFPAEEIDHLNHIRDDNSIENLRVVSHAENHKNKSLQSNNISGIVGVSWRKRYQRWVAQIRVDGKRHHLGYFDNKDDAIAARKAAEIEYGFHSNHGIRV